MSKQFDVQTMGFEVVDSSTGDVTFRLTDSYDGLGYVIITDPCSGNELQVEYDAIQALADALYNFITPVKERQFEERLEMSEE